MSSLQHHRDLAQQLGLGRAQAVLREPVPQLLLRRSQRFGIAALHGLLVRSNAPRPSLSLGIACVRHGSWCAPPSAYHADLPVTPHPRLARGVSCRRPPQWPQSSVRNAKTSIQKSSAPGSRVRTLVVRTREDLQIADEVRTLLGV